MPIVRMRRPALSFLMLMLAATCGTAWGADAPAESTISGADTAWVLVSSALVLFMTPGLALFYGGMVRTKNALSSLMHSFIAMGVITLQWVVIGYSLAFSPGGPYIGGVSWFVLHGVSNDVAWPGYTIPASLFMVFQMMFAIITPALISGAIAERIKYSSYVLFILLWATLVYDPICHWVWASDGWLFGMGALDFAGGTVVHISSGVSALALTLVLGRRIGYPHTAMKPHNLTMTLVGTAILWFGWFGFNAGSSLGANAVGVGAFIATHVAAATAATTWSVIEAYHRGKASALGFASGAVAGLVGITPACGFVDVPGAIAIGASVAAICYGAIVVKSRFGYDDSLDTFGVHGVGGSWGAIATGIFCVAALTPDKAGGLIDSGNVHRLYVQAIGVLATFAYSFVVTFVLARVLDATIGLRVNEEDERMGLDLACHGETGYDM
ncbi:MAG TPA: ammonium transporter [Candidatus Limnocylindrales bacterium]|nr:ammonium transporter [Candidatus Limnocylindrales bacterium]